MYLNSVVYYSTTTTTATTSSDSGMDNEFVLPLKVICVKENKRNISEVLCTVCDAIFKIPFSILYIIFIL